MLLHCSEPSKNEAYLCRKHAKKEYAVHYVCVQDRFLRMSRLRKIDFLKSLLSEVKSLASLSLLLNTLYSAAGKLEYYSKFTGSTNFVYDKVLLDHDRSLEKQTMEDCNSNDIDWFISLEDVKQVSVTIGLLRISGGPIKYEIYKFLREHYELVYSTPKPIKQEQNSKLFSFKSITDVSAENLLDSDLPLKTAHRLQIIPINANNYVQNNPKDPLVKEVEKRRKNWKIMIDRYRAQVEKVRQAKDNKSQKSSKSGKTKSNKSKKNKQSKKDKSKKRKNKNIEEDESLDWVQLLPVWVIKKIFSYLDKKTIKKAKKVNPYWTYAINDLLKEQKARKKINKVIKKMESAINPDRGVCQFVMPIPEKKLITSTDKRLEKLSTRGAVHPKLKPKFTKLNNTNSLVTKAPQGMENFYFLPITKLLSLPRNVITDETLHEKPACILCDIGFTIINPPGKELHPCSTVSSISDNGNATAHLQDYN